MFKIGDFVISLLDGTKGIILEIKDGRYHVIWEDHFSSWEKPETLQRVTA
ncbi:hypothetical protein AB6A23_00695 [Paenibacillus tarimensis]